MAQRKSFPTATYGSEVGYDFIPPPAANNSPAKLVLILGHSYVAILFASLMYEVLPFQFHKLALRGTTVESIRDSASWERLEIFWPALTILIIGSDNISSLTSPGDLANTIQNLVQQVEQLTRGSAIILIFENRLRLWRISSERFKAIKNSTNR